MIGAIEMHSSVGQLLFRRMRVWETAPMPTDAARLALLIDSRALNEWIARLVVVAAEAQDAVLFVLGQ